MPGSALPVMIGPGWNACYAIAPARHLRWNDCTRGARINWFITALLIARIYEVFPLCCPQCCGPMRIIAFINDGAEIRKILEHIGGDPKPPKITPARGPPLCDGWDGEEPLADPDAWEEMDQRRPDVDTQIDQRIVW